MNYPLFVFYDDHDVVCFGSPEEFWSAMEPESFEYVERGIYDCEGKVITATEDERGIELTASTANPERLQSLLIHALRTKGQQWASDTPLDALVPAAQDVFRYHEGIPLGETVTRLLRWLRVRR